MKVKCTLIAILSAGLALTLTACQSPQAAKPGETAQPANQRVAQAAVDEGAKQYEAGNFQGAIKVLSTTGEINLAKTETQVRAHKLLAFSYCASGKPSFCRAEFVKILLIDPNFKLSESERSHPIWGPIYESVRK